VSDPSPHNRHSLNGLRVAVGNVLRGSLHAEQGSPASGRSRSCPNRLVPRPGSATPFFACRGAYARSELGRLVRFWGSHSAILDLPLIAVEALNMATASAYALGWSLVRGLTALESRGEVRAPEPGLGPMSLQALTPSSQEKRIQTL
jgi:hypothetical protein